MVNKRFRYFMYLLYIVLCIGSTSSVFQNDTFYSIKIGGDILKYGVDMIDHYSIHNLIYSYPHWLFDILIYYINNFFGFFGIYLFCVLMYIITIFSVYYVCNKICKNEFVSLFVGVVCLRMLPSFITARAQILSGVLFLYELYFIYRYMDTGKNRYCVYLFFISLIVVNVHCAVWPFFFILFLPFIFNNLFIWFISKFKNNGKVKLGFNSYNGKIVFKKYDNIKGLLIVLSLCLLSGFITPIGNYAFTYFIRTSIGISQKYIFEHQPIVLFQYLGLVFVIGIFIIMLLCTNIKVRFGNLLLIVGVFFMCICSIRHIMLLAIICSIPCSKIISDFFILENDNSIEQFLWFFNKNIFMIGSIIFVLVYGYFLFKKNFTVFVDDTVYPVNACDYIIDNIDLNDFRMYNGYLYGAYLLYRDIPVFIDSRADLYLKEFNNISVFKDFVKLNENYNYKKFFDKYNFNYVLVNKKDESFLSNVLSFNDNYNDIYEDDYFILYEVLNYENEV